MRTAKLKSLKTPLTSPPTQDSWNVWDRTEEADIWHGHFQDDWDALDFVRSAPGKNWIINNVPPSTPRPTVGWSETLPYYMRKVNALKRGYTRHAHRAPVESAPVTPRVVGVTSPEPAKVAAAVHSPYESPKPTTEERLLKEVASSRLRKHKRDEATTLKKSGKVI